MSKDSTAKKVVAFDKARKKKTKSETGPVGSARGIESMFRNAYRAQLDMIALAATKANIMISLNGFLVSILFVSGAYLLDAEPLLLIPVSAFLVTCTASIVFAVLAARPKVNRSIKSLDDFRSDKADLLIFSQFAKLSKDDYLAAMMEMMRNNDRVYRNMIVHVHDLGRTADKKFSLLYISYSAFMVGLMISVGLLLLLGLNDAFLGIDTDWLTGFGNAFAS